jgi:biotin synthase
MESPDHVRLSLAAAMTLGLAPGIFHRNARLGCINLLMTYGEGCKANCAFCGLARQNPHQNDPKFEKFIRVSWRAFHLDQIIERCNQAPKWVERICVSMITNPKARADVLDVCRRVRAGTNLPVSLLIAPTLLEADDLRSMRDAGADRIGVAIDCARPDLFDRLRGKTAGGPHRWDRYWRVYEQSIDVFGPDRAGVHLIHGLGETEADLAEAMDRARRMGGSTHLFCFFPERFSALGDRPQPSASGYRRIQLARWLIDGDLADYRRMTFDERGRIVDFGLDADTLEAEIASGRPFMTSGCPGASGEVACNRPYGNEKPGPDLRNYPFRPEGDDVALIRRQLIDYR